MTADEMAPLLAARIRELRLEAELTQEEIADRVGTHRPLVSRMERGTHCPGLEQIWRYAAALEVEPALILCVLDPVWREAAKWSPEEVERWWPRGIGGGSMNAGWQPTDARS